MPDQLEPHPDDRTDDRLERFLSFMGGFNGSLAIAGFSTLVQVLRGSWTGSLPMTLALCFALALIGAEVGRRLERQFLGSKALHVRGLEALRLFIPLIGLAVILRQVLLTLGSAPEVIESSLGLIQGVFLRGALGYTQRWGETTKR
jgi:hypothetical protein